MIACAMALAVLAGSGALAPVGTAYHYNTPGRMAHVAALRAEPIDWGHISGLVSLPECGYVQPADPYFVRARFWERGAWGPWRVLQVVDCSRPGDLPRHRRLGIAPYGLEADYGTARAGGWLWDGQAGAGHTRVQVGAIWQK